MNYQSLLFSFLIYLLAINVVFANNSKYAKIDEHAKNAPNELRTSLPDLTQYLIESATDDFEKVRAIFVWMATNIAYDVETLKLKKSLNPNKQMRIIRTLRLKKGICQNYAEVFEAMCQQANLPVQYISGWVKPPELKNHAWNAVQLAGKWYLIDVTWGAGCVSKDKYGRLKFHQRLDDDYFLANPKQFIVRHLPRDPLWQLIENPISYATFKSGHQAIKLALEKDVTPFNYTDSLAVLKKLSILDQTINISERTYQFNKNKLSQYDLSQAYWKKAAALGKSEYPPNTSNQRLIILVDEVIFYYKKAEQYAYYHDNRAYYKMQLKQWKIAKKNLILDRKNLQ